MGKILPLIALLLLFGAGYAFSQVSDITGTVTSAENGQPLSFVTIVVKGTTNAVNSDADGKYTLRRVMAGDTILFSFVGYATREIIAGTQNVVNVTLQPNSELDEVVVTALALNRQKRELGYSTEKVSGDEIRQSNSPNVLNALTGKAAGVQIANPNGVDGGTTRITIRGNNSIGGNNQPLIVVDGIPISNDPGMVDVGRGRDWGSAINNINMEDVEDIQILKGGAASALYGSRGANGVVLITTKKGRQQKGLGISYNLSYKISDPYRYRDVQNTYGGGAPSTLYTAPDFTYSSDGTPMLPSLSTDAEFGYPGSAVSWGPAYNGQMILWWDSVMRPWSPQPENLQIPFRNGHTATHNLSVEGAGEAGSLRVSLTRTDNSPIVYNSNYNQTTLSTNSNLKVSDRISLGLSAAYTDYHRLNSPMLGEDPSSFSKGLLYSWPRSYLGEDLSHYTLPDGTRDPLEGYPYLYIDQYLWWNYYNNNTTLDRIKLTGGLTLNYAITDWLTFTGRTGIDYTGDEFEQKNKPADLIGLLDGYYAVTQQRDRSYNNEFLLTATRNKIFNSGINASVNFGGSSWDRNMRNQSAHSGTWYFPNWYSLSNYTPTVYGQDADGNTIVISKGDDPASLIPQATFYRKRINSLYAFLNLSYKNFLFAELTGRNDWSSTLPENANSYFYPGISVSFIASDAFNFKNDWLSFFKIRMGAAQTATDTDPYLTEFYYTTGLWGGDQYSLYPGTIPPVALKPQRVNSYEAGTSLGFNNDRITLDFTYYYKYCFDQIISLPLPASSGAPLVSINEGVLSNRGWEVTLSATVLQQNHVAVKTGLNISRNRNKVVSLGDFADTYILADIWGENGPQMALHAGDDFGTILGWDYVYKNGQPVVSDDGKKYEITDTRVPIGNAAPDFLAGWTTEFRYKNFTLRTLIDTKWGGDIYCGSYVIGLQTGQSPATLTERDGDALPFTDTEGNESNSGVILPGVHEDGTPNETVVHYYYKYMPNAGGWGHFLSTPGIVEDTWVKFREVSLSYSLPASAVKKLKIFRELSVSVTGRDLFYIYNTLPDHINPEGIMGAGDAQGFEWASLPGVRSFSFSLNAGF